MYVINTLLDLTVCCYQGDSRRLQQTTRAMPSHPLLRRDIYSCDGGAVDHSSITVLSSRLARRIF